jgi:hypothetical protein
MLSLKGCREPKKVEKMFFSFEFAISNFFHFFLEMTFGPPEHEIIFCKHFRGKFFSKLKPN